MAALGHAAIAIAPYVYTRAEPYRFPFPPYPSGWFAVAWASELAAGAVVPVDAFGRRLVAYRTEAGRAVVADAYCPHLGAHLGFGGSVEGECIRCPFHRWKYAADGRCVEVPYQGRPSRARLRTWPTAEVDGMLLVWHDVADSAPDWQVDAMPDTHDFCMPEAPEACHWTLRTHAQEIVENAFDVAHFPAVHGMGLPPRPDLRFDGARATIAFETVSNGAAFGLNGTFPARVRMDVLGLGVLQADTELPDFGFCFRNTLYMTPLDEQHIRLRAALSVRRLADDDTTAALQEIWVQTFAMDLPKDFAIWENKLYVERPELSRVDGPIVRMRRWAEQFYGRAAAQALLPIAAGAGSAK